MQKMSVQIPRRGRISLLKERLLGFSATQGTEGKTGREGEREKKKHAFSMGRRIESGKTGG